MNSTFSSLVEHLLSSYRAGAIRACAIPAIPARGCWRLLQISLTGLNVRSSFVQSIGSDGQSSSSFNNIRLFVEISPSTNSSSLDGALIKRKIHWLCVVIISVFVYSIRPIELKCSLSLIYVDVVKLNLQDLQWFTEK